VINRVVVLSDTGFHLFEALSVSDDRPPHLVVGSGGTDLSKPSTGTKSAPGSRARPSAGRLRRSRNILDSCFGSATPRSERRGTAN
jgi:hypothetical protein